MFFILIRKKYYIMGFLGSVAGALTGGLLGYKAQKSANKANVDLWEAQANYNTPAQQMKRLKEAGLNPYLYAEGTSGGEMSNSPTFQANNALSNSISQASQMAMNYENRKRELDLKQQQTDLNEEVIRKTTLDADLLDLEKKKRQFELKQMKQNYSKTSQDIMLDELGYQLNMDKHKLAKAIFENNKEYRSKYYNLAKYHFANNAVNTGIRGLSALFSGGLSEIFSNKKDNRVNISDYLDKVINY